MKKDLYEKLCNILLPLMIFFVLILLAAMILNFFPQHETVCDYDSCSQFVIGNVNYSGSVCFESYNPDCQDFLRFWKACQGYKQKMGVKC